MEQAPRDNLANIKRLGRASAVLVRSTNRSALFGLALVAVSSASIYATANTPPQFTNLSATPSPIDEGQTVTLTGTFTDPDAADLHSVNINWYDGTPHQKIQLPAGQYSFTATHTYRDNRKPGYHNIGVWVFDKDAAPGPNDNTGDGIHWDGESVPLEVKNVAPSFAHNVTVTKAPGNPRKVTIEGDLIDPGTDSFEVRAKWGDSNANPFDQGDECTMSRRHFKCEHQYAPAEVRGYRVELTATDDDGGTTKKNVNVQIP